ncbi:MAG TPA: hypothetical protein VN419_09685 [Humidesulfovibrio sp.]|uniref:hypothetical protein n=1 Tax=Humidesulfovibrio sp. TaxID=2910988 RepID=UPI002B915EFF|nr:hypothetical protein [Humidesulfovibrio sp.]HWR04278.1 hypothetical protein [Humidesulfovibrio sp.]
MAEPGAELAADLAVDLAAYLKRGLPLDAQSLSVIRQTLGEADPARALALLAADPGACEHAPLVALLFSPGAAMRRELEPVLTAADMGEADAAELARRVGALAAGPLALLLPGGQRLDYPARQEDVRGFVLRLRPGATAPPELRRVIGRRCGGKDADQEQSQGLCALLRHSRLKWSPARVFFLAALLERAEDGDDLPALTAWALGFLDLAGEVFAPREALRERRAALSRMLHLAEAFEDACGKASFEVRLSQGQRQGHVHGPDVLAERALLDRACELVLGVPGQRLENGPDQPLRLDLGETDDAAELLRLLNL